MSNRPKLIIIQAVVPDYRIGFFEKLREQRDIIFVYGDRYFADTVTTDEESHRLGGIRSTNLFLFKRRLMLQMWPKLNRLLFSTHTAVVELNPRAITSWLFLFRRFIRSAGPTIVWGHLRNRKGRMTISRRIMLRISRGAIFYTKSQASDCLDYSLNIDGPIGFAPNALFSRDEISPPCNAGNDFIYVGRLVSEKKVGLLLDAFHLALSALPEDAKLHIVGTGPLQGELQQKAGSNHALSKRIVFHGHVSDRENLATLYESAVVSVSPGYVGLSITQSLSFGRPMLVADREPHAPEIEALREDQTGQYFSAGDVTSLANALVVAHANRADWHSRAAEICDFCASNYTYESMAAGFSSLIAKAEYV